MELLKAPQNACNHNSTYGASRANLDQRVVMHKIAARSERLIVMSQYSSRILQEVFKVLAEKIELIPHGIPDLPFEQPDLYKKRFSCQSKSVLLNVWSALSKQRVRKA